MYIISEGIIDSWLIKLVTRPTVPLYTRTSNRCVISSYLTWVVYLGTGERVSLPESAKYQSRVPSSSTYTGAVDHIGLLLERLRIPGAFFRHRAVLQQHWRKMNDIKASIEEMPSIEDAGKPRAVWTQILAHPIGKQLVESIGFITPSAVTW